MNELNHQIVNLPEGKLNHPASSSVIGGHINTLTGAALYPGMLGSKLAIGKEDALAASDTDIGTLYQGVYQYVKTKAGSTEAPARGLVAFWANAADIAAQTVTPDHPANTGCIAGVYITAPTKGEYCWIQRSGLASVLFADSITRATPAAQDMVFCKADDNVAQQEEGATTVTVNMLARHLGVAAEAPVAGQISLVELWERFNNL